MIRKTLDRLITITASAAVFIALAFFAASSEVRADGELAGSGTSDDPYRIQSTEDWNTFAGWINSGINNDSYYILTDELSGVTMPVGTVGDSPASFKGSFNGDGHTISFDINDTSGTSGTAPFRSTDGAVIQDLYVSGTISGNGHHVSGLVGIAYGETTITDVNIDADIISTKESDRHAAAVIGHCKSSKINMTDVIFSGTVSETEYGGGLIGWGGSETGGTVNMTDCIYMGTHTSTVAFHPVITTSGYNKGTMERVWYTQGPTGNDAYLKCTEGILVSTSVPDPDSGIYKRIVVNGQQLFILFEVKTGQRFMAYDDHKADDIREYDIDGFTVETSDGSMILTEGSDYTVEWRGGSQIPYEVGMSGVVYIATVSGNTEAGYYGYCDAGMFYITEGANYKDGTGTVMNADLDPDNTLFVSPSTTVLNKEWCLITDNMVIDHRLTVNGNVNLLILNGVTVTIKGGISVTSGNSLTICQQNDEGTMPKLIIPDPENILTDTSYDYSGIGGWAQHSSGSVSNQHPAGNITINGCDLDITGSNYAAAIGGSNRTDCGNITINGGTINARTGWYGAAIGTGDNVYSSSGSITINGGTITSSNGDYGASAIGGGGAMNSPSNNRGGEAGLITINGGTITANGSSSGSAIGSGINRDFAGITITGGKITCNNGCIGSNAPENSDSTTKNRIDLSWTAASFDTMSLTAPSYVGRVYLDRNFMNLSSGDTFMHSDEVLPDSTVRSIGGITLTPYAYGDHLAGHSLLLEDDIGVNFYMELDEDVIDMDTAYVSFLIPSGDSTYIDNVYVKEGTGHTKTATVVTDQETGKKYYVFKCNVAAKQMTSEISAQLKDKNGEGIVYTYSVREYAKYILDHTDVQEYADAAPLVKALVTYGSMAQVYFGVNVNDLANNIMEEWEREVLIEALEYFTIDDDAGYYEGPVRLDNGFEFSGASLVLKSKTVLKLYFDIPEGLNGTLGVVSTDNKPVSYDVQASKDGRHVVLRIKDIKPADIFNRNYLISCVLTSASDGAKVDTFYTYYSPANYAYNVLNDRDSDDTIKNLVRALIYYSDEADHYAGGA